MSFPQIERPNLPPNTIVPEEESLFIPYLNRLYEDIAFAVNSKDDGAFEAAISNVPVNIPDLPNFGAYFICVSGTSSFQPTYTASLAKSDANTAGVIVPHAFQAGTAGTPWAGIVLTITATATNFQIAHNLPGVTGNFSIRIIGTQ